MKNQQYEGFNTFVYFKIGSGNPESNSRWNCLIKCKPIFGCLTLYCFKETIVPVYLNF